MYLKTVVFKNLLNIPLLIVIIDPYENHVLGLFGLFILFRLMLVDDELFVLYINLYDHQLGHGKWLHVLCITFPSCCLSGTMSAFELGVVLF